jgi:transcriptional regulator with XRE-family HTH domain
MLETVGQKLQKARGKRKLSLDDASRATKIRSRQLADLEADEYSNFPNLAYAKGFLISYGKYLEVDVRPFLSAFEDANSFGLDNYQYLSDVPLGVYRAARRPVRRKSGRRRYALLAGALGLVGLGFLCWQLYVSYQRLGDLDKLADHQEALERGSGGTSVPQPSPTEASSPAAAPAASEPAERAGAVGDAVESAPQPGAFHGAANDALPSGGALPPLPLPDDGSALRQLLPHAGEAAGPFSMYGDLGLPPAGKPGEERGSWSPENLDGYRFYVRSLDRNTVEIFRTGVPRTETVLNNPL